MRQPANPLFRLLLWNWLAGAAAAVILIGGLLATDAMRIRHLIFSSDMPIVPLAMLTIGFLVTLCSVAMGSAIMAMDAGDDSDVGGRHAPEPVMPARAIPVEVAVEARRSPRR